MALTLGRLEIDAATLWQKHPPALRFAQKQAILDLAGGLARVPRGTLAVSRWAPAGEARVGPSTVTVSLPGPFTYPRAAADVDAWHVNFADTELFAFYGGPAFAQDEIQVAEHPILASVRHLLLPDGGAGDGLRALTRETERATPVLVRNVERWCAIDTQPELAMPYGIYGRRLGRASDETLRQAVTRLDDAPATNILAIVAPQGFGRYSREQLRDIVVTAVTGFQAARAESTPGLRLRIHSGHWGTGAFGGHRVLMAAAQVLAARMAGVDELAYHSLEDDGVTAFGKGLALADSVAEGASLEEVVDLLDARAFVWGASDGN